jgi:serine/threonine-protein kinase RsbW
MVRATTENISHVRNFVAQCAEACGCGPEVTDQIRLAVDEAFTNVVKHAYQFNDAMEVDIRVEFDATSFKVILSDQGIRFHPGVVRDPNVEERIRQRKRGGVGVYLIHKLMDDVQYLRQGNHNEIVMTKRL